MVRLTIWSLRTRRHNRRCPKPWLRSRHDPAMQHRSPLQPPAQEPMGDELDWNVSGSIRAYHLSKRAANPNKDLSLPGHVPGMIKTNLISLTEVVKNPKLLEQIPQGISR